MTDNENLGREFFADVDDMAENYQVQLKAVEEMPLSFREREARAVGYKDWSTQRQRHSLLSPQLVREFDTNRAFDYGSILDVGCGMGEYADRFVKFPVVYTGIDVVPEFIEKATARFKKGSERLFIEGDFLEKAGDFAVHDLVVACGTFTYLPEDIVFEMLASMWNLAGKAMAFSILKVQVDRNWVTGIPSRLGCVNYLLRETDSPPDYTMYLYKDAKKVW